MIILIDSKEFIPTKCSQCERFCIDGRCTALGRPLDDVSSRLPDCPIKYLPARVQAAHGLFQSIEEAYQRGLNDGWNSCVDAIERD